MVTVKPRTIKVRKGERNGKKRRKTKGEAKEKVKQNKDEGGQEIKGDKNGSQHVSQANEVGKGRVGDARSRSRRRHWEGRGYKGLR